MIINNTCAGIANVLFVFQYYKVAARLNNINQKKAFFLRQSIVKRVKMIQVIFSALILVCNLGGALLTYCFVVGALTVG